jgi:hypothetical protein
MQENVWMKHATIFLLLLGGLCAGVLIVKAMSAHWLPEPTCQPAQKRPDNRLRELQRPSVPFGRPTDKVAG